MHATLTNQNRKSFFNCAQIGTKFHSCFNFLDTQRMANEAGWRVKVISAVTYEIYTKNI